MADGDAQVSSQTSEPAPDAATETRGNNDARTAGSNDNRDRAQSNNLVTKQRHWDMNVDIPWDQFDASKVDPELLRILKAASLVEYNAWDYATYLNNVFSDDPDMQADATAWAYEEVQHGAALGKWCEHADPNWSHKVAFDRFVAGFRPDVTATESIRGSRAGEMVARCMVEVGTSSYYGSMAAATEEPALKEICKRIAADELRHYKMFYKNLKRYLPVENPSRWERFKVAIGRVVETEDDELSFAYYSANESQETPYDRERYNKAYMRRAFEFYSPKQIERAVSMTWKASGLNPQSRVADLAARAAWRYVRYKANRLSAQGV
jgi:rubrerythrin